jgi:hypothetical protein
VDPADTASNVVRHGNLLLEDAATRRGIVCS